MLRIRRDDTVMVMAGKDKGKTGKVVRVSPKFNKAVVENINVVKKSVKKSDTYPQGGYIEMEKPVALANLMLVDKKSNKPTRFTVKILKDGWTVITQDGSLSAHFEHTVLVTEDKPEILTCLETKPFKLKAA